MGHAAAVPCFDWQFNGACSKSQLKTDPIARVVIWGGWLAENYLVQPACSLCTRWPPDQIQPQCCMGTGWFLIRPPILYLIVCTKAPVMELRTGFGSLHEPLDMGSGGVVVVEQCTMLASDI